MFGLNLFLPPTQQSLLNEFKPPGLIMKIILSGRWYKVKIALKGTSESLQVCCAAGVVQLLSQLQLFETPWNARLPCPSLFAWVCSNSCPLSQWCYTTISSSATPFSCPQSFPASGSFPMSQFASDDQSIWASASASVLPMNIQGWFLFGLTGLISTLSKGLSRVFCSTSCVVTTGYIRVEDIVAVN